MDQHALRSRAVVFPARPGLVLLCLLSVSLLVSACSDGSGRHGRVTPAGVQDGMMYGQGDIDFVLEHFPAFRSRMGMITPDPQAVSYLASLDTPITLKLFVGTWCVDSRLHMPVLFQAIQQADNSMITVQVIGLDRQKKDRDGLTEEYQIALTPTVVVEQEGRELGRMVEMPLQDTAADVVAILRTTLGG